MQEGTTPSDVLRKMLNIDGSAAVAAALAPRPPPAAGVTPGITLCTVLASALLQDGHCFVKWVLCSSNQALNQVGQKRQLLDAFLLAAGGLAYDHSSSSALRQMLKIPGSSSPMPEVHSNSGDLGM